MTDEELKEMAAQTLRSVQELRESQQETSQVVRKLGEENRETGRVLRELGEETDRRLDELGKQIGGLGNKFGGFTEGMAFPSMVRLLEAEFHMDHIAPRYRVHKNGRTLEIDVFAYTNTERNEAFVIEVKSFLDEDGLKQILRILGDVPRFLPEHRDKKLYGVLACVDAKEEVKAKVLDAGVYLAEIPADTFQLKVPEDFKPRCFQQNAPESSGSV